MFKFSNVLELLITYVWPWIRDHILPEIRDAMNDIGKAAGVRMREFLDWVLGRLSRDQQDYANAKAEAADANAKAAASDAEREKHEAVAKVWREVAERFRQDNEALRAKFEEFAAREEQKMHDDINAMKPDMDTSSGKPELVIGTTRTTLPSLPAVSD